MNPAIELMCDVAKRLGVAPWQYGPVNHNLRVLACNGHAALWVDAEELPEATPPGDAARTLERYQFPNELGEVEAARLREWAGPPLALLECGRCHGKDDQDVVVKLCHVCGGEGVTVNAGRRRNLDGALLVDGAYAGLFATAGDPSELVKVERGDNSGVQLVRFTAQTWTAVLAPLYAPDHVGQGTPLFGGGR